MSTVAAQWMLGRAIDGLSYVYDGVRFVRPVRFGDTVTVAYAEVDRSQDADVDSHPSGTSTG